MYHSLSFSCTVANTTPGEDGTGFVQIETLLVRLNTTYAPNGRFKAFGPRDAFTNSSIGMDAVVCLEIFEPFVMELYNNTIGEPLSVQVDSKGNVIGDVPGRKEKKIEIKLPKHVVVDDPLKDVVRVNSTGLGGVFAPLHANSINLMVKVRSARWRLLFCPLIDAQDNGRDSFYVPSTTVRSNHLTYS